MSMPGSAPPLVATVTGGLKVAACNGSATQNSRMVDSPGFAVRIAAPCAGRRGPRPRDACVSAARLRSDRAPFSDLPHAMKAKRDLLHGSRGPDTPVRGEP